MTVDFTHNEEERRGELMMLHYIAKIACEKGTINESEYKTIFKALDAAMHRVCPDERTGRDTQWN